MEVKYRLRFTLAAKSARGYDVNVRPITALADRFTSRPTREVTIWTYTSGKTACKVLVTTHQMLGKSTDKRKRMEHVFCNTLAKKGYPGAQVWYFDAIIPALVRELNPLNCYRLFE
jgi:hypothetical protein